MIAIDSVYVLLLMFGRSIDGKNNDVDDNNATTTTNTTTPTMDDVIWCGEDERKAFSSSQGDPFCYQTNKKQTLLEY